MKYRNLVMLTAFGLVSPALAQSQGDSAHGNLNAAASHNRYADLPPLLFLEFNTEDLENHGRFVTPSGPKYGPSSGGPESFEGVEYPYPPAEKFQDKADRAAQEYCQKRFGYKYGTSLEVTARQLHSKPPTGGVYVYRIKRLVCHISNGN